MAARYLPPADRRAFEIAIICALPVESDAVEAVFDEFWGDDDHDKYGKAPGDTNSYIFSRIGRHNVALAYLPGIGKSSSASTAASFRASFSHVRLGLVVGVCGGVPQPMDQAEEVFLGDVIISTRIIQFDFGRQFDDRMIRKHTLQDDTGRPNQEIRAFIHKVQGYKGRSSVQKYMTTYITDVLGIREFRRWHAPGLDEDHLYQTSYRHQHHSDAICRVCTDSAVPDAPICDIARSATCAQLQCDVQQLVRRDRNQATSDPLALALHFGPIASGDTVMKSAWHRDRIASKEQVIGFEMEGAGVWDSFPTIVIKGVCDYADSHKNKDWQKYAAVTAAACTKAILREWRGSTSASVDNVELVNTDSVSYPNRKSDLQGVQDDRGGGIVIHNYGKVSNQANHQTVNGNLNFA